MVLRSATHQNKMLNSTAFRDFDWDLILAPRYLQLQDTFSRYCILIWKYFSYPRFTLLSRPTPELAQLQSLINKIILLRYNDLSKTVLVLRWKAFRGCDLLFLIQPAFISSLFSNLNKLLLSLEWMSTPEIMSKNSPDSYNC